MPVHLKVLRLIIECLLVFFRKDVKPVVDCCELLFGKHSSEAQGCVRGRGYFGRGPCQQPFPYGRARNGSRARCCFWGSLKIAYRLSAELSMWW